MKADFSEVEASVGQVGGQLFLGEIEAVDELQPDDAHTVGHNQRTAVETGQAGVGQDPQDARRQQQDEGEPAAEDQTPGLRSAIHRNTQQSVSATSILINNYHHNHHHH